MRRVLAYEHGRPVWSLNEPSYAHLQGVGGSGLGTVFIVAQTHPHPHVGVSVKRRGQLCQRLTRWGDPCARLERHSESCASRAAMDRKNEWRRSRP